MMLRVITGQVRRYIQRAAAPEGGAQRWVRGCAFALVSIPQCIAAEPLPSGQSVELYEVLIDEVGEEAWLRFRFLAPQIARSLGQLSYADVEPDMAVLCEDMALGYIEEHALQAEKIAISLSDRPVPFGAPDPEATQFIEVYSIENARCIWEAF